MAVYRPRRERRQSKFYVCEFVYQGKRIQESTGCTTKTAAESWEQKRKRELERAHAGLPCEQRSNRIKTVAEIVKPYLSEYGLTHRESSVAFARTKLGNIIRLLGSVLLSDSE
jgi:hypothetical protein